MSWSWSNPSSEDAQEAYDYYKGKYNSAANQKIASQNKENRYISDRKNAVSDKNACIEMANSIFITNIAEYEERRLWQDKAIGYYNRAKQELNFISNILKGKINVNKYMDSIKKIKKEIGLISAWRKADNQIKKRL